MNIEAPQWRTDAPAGLITVNEVHIWRVFLSEAHSNLDRLKEILSTDELRRSENFHFENDRKRFILSRGILRSLLVRYLHEDPRDVCIEYTDFGKPILAADTGRDILSFNVSHSGDVILYAITQGQKIGVDVEQIKGNYDIAKIARSFFSPGELDAIDRVHEKDRIELFFRYWTRKEAIVKALGQGISFPMEQLDVSLINEVFTNKFMVESSQVSFLSLKDLYPSEGYAGAFAVEGNDFAISCWHYSKSLLA